MNHDIVRLATSQGFEFAPRWAAAFFGTGCKAGIQPAHAELAVLRLDGATGALDMNLPGCHWYPLKDDLAGHWAVSVDGNWRLTFSFEGTDAILVDYRDYH